MKNRITHLLKDWTPEVVAGEAKDALPPAGARRPYPLPRGINMLMPVELCINRDLLITMLSASIQEMHRHKRATPSPESSQIHAELEAALQQQLAFRAWVRDHPANYICIAMYPTTEADIVGDMEDLGDA
ncbi:MAG TPA: hypothetical protein VMG41_10965 [Gemmatimonadales bacterium]|nr:hypothetical protein [Gemmatimonadales bacterium]